MDKKTKFGKYGMKFQSAGTLISISDDGIGKDTPIVKKTTAVEQKVFPKASVDGGTVSVGRAHSDLRDRQRKMIHEKKASYTTKWERAGASKPQLVPAPPKEDTAPPPLMSRQRELTMEKYADRTSDDDEEADFTAKAIIKKAPKFKFKIGSELS